MANPVISVVAAVIESGDRYLITQRKPGAVLPLLWEFPGGRVEKGEDAEAALAREIQERIGCGVRVREKIGEREHPYDGYTVRLSLFACELPQGAVPAPVGVNAVRWVTSEELGDYEFPPADQSSVDELLGIVRWPEE